MVVLDTRALRGLPRADVRASSNGVIAIKRPVRRRMFDRIVFLDNPDLPEPGHTRVAWDKSLAAFPLIGAMAPFDGLLLKPVLAACFCGRCKTCMGRTAADHRRTLPRRRTSTYRASTSRAARSGAGRTALQLFSWRTAAPRNSTDACRPVPAHDETRSPRSCFRRRGVRCCLKTGQKRLTSWLVAYSR